MRRLFWGWSWRIRLWVRCLDEGLVEFRSWWVFGIDAYINGVMSLDACLDPRIDLIL